MNAPLSTSTNPKTVTTTETLKQITHLAAALKAPRITEAAARLADHARDAGWTHEDYLAAIAETRTTVSAEVHQDFLEDIDALGRV